MTEFDNTWNIELLEARLHELALKKNRKTPVPRNWLAGASLYGFVLVVITKLATVWAEGPASAKPPITVASLIHSIQPMHVAFFDSWPWLVGGLVAFAAMYLAVQLRFSALDSVDRDAISGLCSVFSVIAVPVALYLMWEPALPAVQAVFDSIRNR